MTAGTRRATLGSSPERDQRLAAALLAASIGAASIFMADEGLQLLTYDYDEIENPARTLFVATLTAIIAFLFTFSTVNVLPALRVEHRRWTLHSI